LHLSLILEHPCKGIRDPAQRRIIAAVGRDGMEGRSSRLKAMIEVRNQNSHVESPPDHLTRATSTMKSLLEWLERDVVRR
jgi:hypothetical protein